MAGVPRINLVPLVVGPTCALAKAAVSFSLEHCPKGKFLNFLSETVVDCCCEAL